MDDDGEDAYISTMSPLATPLTLVPRDYPELALLCWNRDPARPIPAEEAFALYEGNWRHVDTDRLTPEEAALIERLVDQYGHGHLLVA
jgi:hypothetical protein